MSNQGAVTGHRSTANGTSPPGFALQLTMVAGFVEDCLMNWWQIRSGVKEKI